MPDDEEILELNKLSEGDPDSEDEGEFTGNEAAENTLRYHNTVAVLVKKKSVHRYMGQVTQYSSTGNLYTENMVQMVIDDMAGLWKIKLPMIVRDLQYLKSYGRLWGPGGARKYLPLWPCTGLWILKIALSIRV
ncbi:hypothetical protein ColLi_05553 [Colletotrichum liriopes]|uniref:Uncharacterized protein n=1 Tax=Colletotrichum liriopes TaxID=708192 RepID=A0AA37GKP0_9PEZI|nr:hypothetical protein ColLi_05553 [Colletotrichum liriopes]